MLDYGVRVKLNNMLNKNPDAVIYRCMEQGEVWKAQRGTNITDRQVMEARVVELEKKIDNLTRAIEDGQPVGNALKERKQELDTLRWKLDEPEPLPTRKDFADMLKPLGPLVALGTGDPAGVRSVLRKIGVDRLALVPDADGGWWFRGPADFSALVHERVKAAPQTCPSPKLRPAPSA